MDTKKILKDAEILDAVKVNGADAEKVAKALNISTSNAYYRLRELKRAGRLNADGKIIDGTPAPAVAPVVNPADVARCAINREMNAPASVIDCDIDAEALTPAKDDNYIRRVEVDDVLDKLTARGVSAILTGDAGAGKTKAVEQLSARKALPFLRVACDDNATLKEFIGRREIINGSTCFRLGLLTAILQTPAVVLFDEFNALPASKLFFLHELLDNRRFFIKDADGGRVVNVHKDCIILLACNPNGAKYAGTNKMNCALVDRCAVINVAPLSPADIKSAFDTGNETTTATLCKFYADAQTMINSQGLRVVLSLRSIKRIARALREGDAVENALAVNFYNSALLTASDRERDALRELARVVFGIVNGENLTLKKV